MARNPNKQGVKAMRSSVATIQPTSRCKASGSVATTFWFPERESVIACPLHSRVEFSLQVDVIDLVVFLTPIGPCHPSVLWGTAKHNDTER